MDKDCTESRWMVKNGEDDHKVPAMHVECGVQNAECRVALSPGKSGALPKGEPS